MQPTADDMARDLAADLAELDALANEWPEWVGGTMRESDLALFARRAAGAAIRRAMHAEAVLAPPRRLGRVDACRVLNEMAARFPAAAGVLRECVRRIERMGE